MKSSLRIGQSDSRGNGSPDAMPPRTVRRPLCVAHRGGAGLAPENTLAAFQKALALGVDAIELDLHLSQDGALVVMHDADVRATTDGQGAIASLTLADLNRLNAAVTFRGQVEPQRIPTLEAVLALVQGRTRLQIEIKRRFNGTRYAGIEARVVDALRRYDMLSEVVILSFNLPTLQDIKALAPTLPTYALLPSNGLTRLGIGRIPDAVVDQLTAMGIDGVGVRYSLLSKRLLTALRRRHFQVGVWTVNDPAAMRKFADLGVDFITSDRPDLLYDVLQSGC